MTLALSSATWSRLVVWSVLGGAIYAGYGYRHSKMREPPLD